jgi:hypothetical protein
LLVTSGRCSNAVTAEDDDEFQLSRSVIRALCKDRGNCGSSAQ